MKLVRKIQGTVLPRSKNKEYLITLMKKQTMVFNLKGIKLYELNQDLYNMIYWIKDEYNHEIKMCRTDIDDASIEIWLDQLDYFVDRANNLKKPTS